MEPKLSAKFLLDLTLVMASIKAGEDSSDNRIKELYKELSSSINRMKFLY